jgi:hypothetical protein
MADERGERLVGLNRAGRRARKDARIVVARLLDKV